jgi:fatty-acyl-CoA synthase
MRRGRLGVRLRIGWQGSEGGEALVDTGTDGLTRATQLLDRGAARDPAAMAVQFPDAGSTYGELAGSSMLMARRLHAAGVGPGDRVGVLFLRVGVEYIAFCLGALRLGAIAVPINSRYKVHELQHVIEHAGLSLLFTSEASRALLDRTGVPDSCQVVTIEDTTAFDAGERRVSEEDVRTLEELIGPETPARIVYTSGTTAQPKGCLHTHGALLAQGEAVAAKLELTAADRFWTPLTMFHVAGWATMLASHARGASFNHVGLYEPGLALEQMGAQRCTVIFPSFETIWMAVLTHPRMADTDLSAIRVVVNVGVPERMELMQDLLPHAPQISITGSTEACGFLAIADVELPRERRARLAGRPLPGMEVLIVDPETGEPVAPGTPGEMLFRGAWRFREYYRDPEATAAAIDADGWFHSGDLLVQEPDGNLMFLSRIKDMLKVGGENVAAAEIEGYLLTHPAVAMVQVVAAPDARYGEVPAAFLELHEKARLSEAEVVEFCLEQIATFKVPRYVRFVDDWPMSGTKVQKYVLRTQIADELAERGITEAPRIKPAVA